MNILYIHGMGGGADSRIPGILAGRFSAGAGADGGGPVDVSIVCRTYDFDPEIAWEQISSWVEELDPVLVIGESLGSGNALKIRRTPSLSCVPHIFVSPSLNASLYLGCFSWLALIPGVTGLFDRIYKPRPGRRQPLHFTFRTLRKYLRQRREMLSDLHELRESGIYAFFGAHDHYRKSGVVSVRTWERLFGKDSYTIYDGTHFMEEEFIDTLLIPKILLTLQAHN